MKEEYFVVASAGVYGNVQLTKDSNIWFQSILRGDSNTVIIDGDSNIQDGTIIHVDEDTPTIVGKYVAVGHQCMLHGCRVGDGALIGTDSTILNNAITGENNLIGAGSLVTEGRIIPSGVLASGRPVGAIRLLTAAGTVSNHTDTLHYIQRAEELRQQKYPKLTQNWEENDEEDQSSDGF